MEILKLRMLLSAFLSPIYVLCMKVFLAWTMSEGLPSRIIGMTTLFSSLSVILLTWICDIFSKRVAKISYIVMISKLIFLVSFCIMICLDTVSKEAAYILSGILLESVYETVRSKMFRRIKCIVLSNRKRERYDNHNEISRKIGLLIGSGVLIFVELDIKAAIVILTIQSLIMNGFDTFLYFKYRNLDYKEED